MLSVIVITYNDPIRLRLVLHSLLRQTRTDFELLVVHDGGHRSINQPVYEEMRRYGREIQELWLGPASTDFRLAAARNLGLRQARGERVLFLDGDCIAAPTVSAEHAAYGAAKLLVAGARKHLPEKCLAWLQPEHFGQLEQFICGPDERYRICARPYRHLRERLLNGETTVTLTHHEHVWGFQLSAPTCLAREIGGFNEEFSGWGAEDQEFAARMQLAGAALLGRFDLACYHLDHPPSPAGRKWMRKMAESLKQPNPVRNGGPLPGPAVC